MTISDDTFRPTATYLLIALFCLVFMAQHLSEVIPNPSFLSSHITTLIGLGGLNKALIKESGEWYRLLTAAFLHGGLFHLLLNSYAFFIAASFLERYIGRLWLLFIFFTSTVCASLLSCALNPVNQTSVGASGGIMGLFGTMFIVAWLWLPPSPLRQQIFGLSAQVAAFGLLPVLSLFGQNIDYAGHLGGFLSGAVIALLLHWLAPVMSLKRLAPLLWLMNSVYFLTLGYGWYDLFTQYSDFKGQVLSLFQQKNFKK